MDEFLDNHPSFFEGLAGGVRPDPPTAPAIGERPVAGFFVPPPEEVVVPSEGSKPWLSRRGRRTDFAGRDAENRRLGRLGEESVVDVERRRLRELGRDDLAGRVEWVAQTCGDGLGFDVLSFDHEKDSEKMIEVKTTGLGQHFPFLVTANEVRCCEDVTDRFNLYRVFSFSSAPRVYVLPGALSHTCKLAPSLFVAHPGLKID